VLQFNTIANHRTQSQLSLDGLLIRGVDFELDVAQNWAHFLWVNKSGRANSLRQLVNGGPLGPLTPDCPSVNALLRYPRRKEVFPFMGQTE
jgi:hypothetical protein